MASGAPAFYDRLGLSDSVNKEQRARTVSIWGRLWCLMKMGVRNYQHDIDLLDIGIWKLASSLNKASGADYDELWAKEEGQNAKRAKAAKEINLAFRELEDARVALGIEAPSGEDQHAVWMRWLWVLKQYSKETYTEKLRARYADDEFSIDDKFSIDPEAGAAWVNGVDGVTVLSKVKECNYTDRLLLQDEDDESGKSEDDTPWGKFAKARLNAFVVFLRDMTI